jgi:hypothetical protein
MVRIEFLHSDRKHGKSLKTIQKPIHGNSIFFPVNATLKWVKI